MRSSLDHGTNNDVEGQTMSNALRQANYACEAAVGVGLIFCLSVSAAAQAPRGTDRESLIVGGAPPPPPKLERCIDVEIGGDHSLGCLNQHLKNQVERVNPSLNLPPLDARSSDIRVGNVNDAAVRQQYGSNYGRSVYPYRPPTSIFVAPRR